MQIRENLNPQDVEDLYDEVIRALICADEDSLESLLASALAKAFGEESMRVRAGLTEWLGCKRKRQILEHLLLKTRSNLSLLHRVTVCPEPAEYEDGCRKWAEASADPGYRTGVVQEDSWPR